MRAPGRGAKPKARAARARRVAGWTSIGACVCLTGIMAVNDAQSTHATTTQTGTTATGAGTNPAGAAQQTTPTTARPSTTIAPSSAPRVQVPVAPHTRTRGS